MVKNLGNADRWVRLMAAGGSAVCAMEAPLPVGLRLVLFGGMSVGLLFTALAGSCMVYRLLGRSTCPATRQSA